MNAPTMQLTLPLPAPAQVSGWPRCPTCNEELLQLATAWRCPPCGYGAQRNETPALLPRGCEKCGVAMLTMAMGHRCPSCDHFVLADPDATWDLLDNPTRRFLDDAEAGGPGPLEVMSHDPPG